MKKTIGLLLTLLLLASTAVGCGGASGGGSTGTESAAESASVGSQAENIAGQGEKVNISIFSYQTSMREDYQKYGENIKKTHPNINLDVSVAPTNDYPQLLKTKVASGDAPDIFSLWPGLSYVTYYAKNGHLLDLSDREWVQYILPGVLPTVTYEDKVYAQPIKMATVGVIYNKAIWNDLDLAIPETWETFLETCETVKQAGIIPLSMPAKTDWPPQFIPIYALPCNILYSVNQEFDNQLYNGEVTFSDSAYKQCFEMFMDLDARGYYNPSPLGVTHEQSQDMMVNGDIAMCVQGDWELASLVAKKSDIDLGMFPLPAPEGYTTTIPVGGDYCHVIFSRTKHPDEALAVVDYMGSQEAFDLSDSLKISIPTLSNIKTELHPGTQDMLVYAEKASYPFTNLVWVPGIQEGFQKGYQELLAGNKTIEQMLADVDEIAVRNIESFKAD